MIGPETLEIIWANVIQTRKYRDQLVTAVVIRSGECEECEEEEESESNVVIR